MNTTFMHDWNNGVMSTKQFATVPESMLVMRMVMDFVRFMSIPLRASGHCCVPG